MIKTAFATLAAAAAVVAPSAALAGPYVNVEANSGRSLVRTTLLRPPIST